MAICFPEMYRVYVNPEVFMSGQFSVILSDLLFSLRTQMVRSDLRVFLSTNEETVVTVRQPIREPRQLELRVSTAQSVLCCRARQCPVFSAHHCIVCTYALTISHSHTSNNAQWNVTSGLIRANQISERERDYHNRSEAENFSIY